MPICYKINYTNVKFFINNSILFKNFTEDEKYLVKLKHVGNAPILKNYMLNFKKNTEIKLIKVYTYVKDSLKNHLKEGDCIVNK